MKHKYKFGLRGPDKQDRRDYIYSAAKKLVVPDSISFLNKCPMRFLQDRNDCVVNGSIGIMQFNDMADDGKFTPLSRRMLYQACLEADGNPHDDIGTWGRTALSCLVKQGVCAEELWPYTKQFDEKPTDDCYADAKKRRAYLYWRIKSLYDAQACLTSGKLFMMGIPVFNSFVSKKVAETGIVPMPGRYENIIGYHQVYTCGYYNKDQRVECVNSWGRDWGNDGAFTLLYEYLERFVLPEGMGDCTTILRQLNG